MNKNDEYKVMRQDIYDFLVQLKTYRSYPDPISMTIDTMTANLGTLTMKRVERAVTERLAEVSPGIFGNVNPASIDTTPDEPEHVQQVIDHLAHLEDYQVEEVKRAINKWNTEE